MKQGSAKLRGSSILRHTRKEIKLIATSGAIPLQQVPNVGADNRCYQSEQAHH